MPQAKVPLPSAAADSHLNRGRPGLRPLLGRMRAPAARLRNVALALTGRLPGSFLRAAVYRLCFRMKIARGATIGPGCTIRGPGRIQIGEGAVINRGVVLDGRFPLCIGKHASISFDAVLLTLEHDLRDPGFGSIGAPVTIGDHAFVGARAVILPGVAVGSGAAVGAGAVVTRDVPPHTVVAGNPARPVGTRPSPLVYRLCPE